MTALPETATATATDVAFRARHGADSLISMAAAGGIYALSLVTGPVLARALGPEGRGDYAAVVVPLQLAAWLLPLGMPLAGAYYVRRYRSRDLVTSAWVVSLAVGLPLATLVWVMAPRILQNHDPTTVRWLQLAMLVGLVLAPLGTVLELVRAEEGAGTHYNALVALGPVLTSLAIILLAATGSLDLESALACTVGASLLWAVSVLVRRRGWPRLPLDRQVLVAQTRFGLRAAGGDLSAMTVARLDQVLMVAMVAAFDLGIYAVAVTAASVSLPVVKAISNALFPHLIHTEGPDRAIRLRNGVRWADTASLGLTAAVALSAPLLIPLLFGQDFHEAVLIVWLLLPGQVLANAAAVRISVLQAEGRPGVASVASGLAAVVTVALLVPMVGAFGIEGAAVTSMVSQSVQLGIVLLALRRLRQSSGARAAW